MVLPLALCGSKYPPTGSAPSAGSANRTLKWWKYETQPQSRLWIVYFSLCREQQQVTTNGTSVKVLVVDDSNTIRRSAEIFLRQGGHEVLLADDGFDALAKVNDYEPQVIFCDILMPKLDGYQTCAIIKRNPRFANTPVVMLSSKDGIFDKARGRMVGCQEYLTKPFTKDQLLQTVRQLGMQYTGAL